MKNYSEFEQQEIVWTPEGNESVINYAKKDVIGFNKQKETDKLEMTTEEYIFIIFEAKQQYEHGPQNLITIEHFKEMIEFEKYMMAVEYAVPPANETDDVAAGEPPTMISFYDMCRKKNVTSAEDEKEWATLCKTDESYCVADALPKCEVS